jgi:hypothetical protein
MSPIRTPADREGQPVALIERRTAEPNERDEGLRQGQPRERGVTRVSLIVVPGVVPHIWAER